MDNHLFSVTIGGIGVTMVCQQKDLCTRLENRYLAFKASDEFSQQMVIHYPSSPQQRIMDREEVSFSSDHLEIKTESAFACFNLETCKSEIWVYSDEPLQSIDYYLRVHYSISGYRAGGFLFHGAGIYHRDRVHIFYGPSGSGKSTVSRLSTDKTVLSDDLLMLLPRGDGWNVFATPFWNLKSGYPLILQGTLSGLYRLIKDDEVYLQPVSSAEAVAEIVSSVPVLTINPQYAIELLTRCAALADLVPCYRLHFRKEDSFWEVIDGLG